LKQTVVLDIEVFPNYFLVAMRNIKTGNVVSVEMWDGKPLDVVLLEKVLKTYRVVTFNGAHYDMPMLALALSGADCAMLKLASDGIINGNLKSWEFYRDTGLSEPFTDHIDIFELLPGMASLKIYGGRLHAPKLQDAPFDFDTPLLPENMVAVRRYCENDLELTQLAFDAVQPQLELRELMGPNYGVDLRSKSDAQIAEAVIRAEIFKRTGERPGKNFVPVGTEFKYDVPHWVSFTSHQMRAALDVVRQATFIVNNKGAVEMPPEVAGLTVDFGIAVFRMGIGGLHSSEKSVCYQSDADGLLYDRDVASYYPNLILNCGIYPEHLGPVFLDVYRGLVEKRLAAKRAGDKVVADTLKIVLNGTFGKLGNMYSCIYSPKLMIQVTLTGQLALLMLIEDLLLAGIDVISANTDGVVSIVKPAEVGKFTRIVEAWEINCGLETEETGYSKLFCRDVNNYFAVKPDGSIKGKGIFTLPGLAKNPDASIVTDAVQNLLADGRQVEDTIFGCKDLRRFLTVRTVKGGAVDQGGNYLGKAVRWYHQFKGEGQLSYKSNGNKVAGSEGARAVQELPAEFPADVDHGYYIRKAYDVIKDLGVLV
jgi:hypothetical protein